MIAAFAQLTSTDTGIVLVGALCLFGWIVGIVFALALVWPRIASTRGRTVSAGGRCTCRALRDEQGKSIALSSQVREQYAQLGRVAQIKFTCGHGGHCSCDRPDSWAAKGIGA